MLLVEDTPGPLMEDTPGNLERILLLENNAVASTVIWTSVSIEGSHRNPSLLTHTHAHTHKCQMLVLSS